MTGAMYSAIAGLKAHMNKLNVIGNNVANVNTVGYKSQRAVFRDSMYTMYSSGSNGTTTKAGKNPSQIGYGSQLSNIDLNMVRGSFNPGAPLDCMLEGDGFFLVGDKNVADQIDAQDPNSFKGLTLSRVGDFDIGPDGYLKDGNGKAVYGFLTVGTDEMGNPIISDQLVPIRLPRMAKVQLDAKTGKPLTPEQLRDDPPLPEGEGEKWVWGSVPMYPEAFVPEGDGADPDAAKNSVALRDYWPAEAGKDPVRQGENPAPFAQLESITIDTNSGRISGTLKDSNQWITVGFLAVGNVTNNKGLTLDGNSTYKCGDGAGDLQISMLGGAAESVQVQTATGKKVGLDYVNGSRVPVDDNGNTIALSDKARVGSAGGTVLRSGGLEGSNADLATEISELITTQRGYQANTRIITVTDSMLEELVNMKR